MDQFASAVTKGALDAVTDLCKDLTKFAARVGRREVQKLSVDTESGFRDYLERNVKRLSKIKTPLNRKNPVLLESVFESPNLNIDETSFDEDGIIDFVAEKRFLVITGMGGSGKSMLLKHLFLRFYNESRGFIPVFIEFRDVPHGGSLKSYIHQQISSVVSSFDIELYEYALASGKFLLMLDGLDEVDHSFAPDIHKMISELQYQYGSNAVIITSRPDNIFTSWSEFYTAEMQGFSRKQVISAVTKMKFDENKKKLFKSAIKESLYNTHMPYLANPLLCTIMLLTFAEGGKIPTKMHVFYQRAFDVLFYQHDATKPPGFVRKLKTSLEIDGFKKVFETFCTFSYIDHGSAFTTAEARDSARKSSKYNAVEFKSDDLIYDLCTSISIMIKEGDKLNFIHRSFQEYFVALFLAHREFDSWGDVVTKISIDKPNDEVVRLLSDINQDKFTQQFFLPRLRLMNSDLRKIDIEVDPASAFHLFYIGFSVPNTREMSHISSYTISRGSERPAWTYLLNIIEKISIHSGTPIERFIREVFDWNKMIDGLDQSHVDRSKYNLVEVTDVTNEAIIGTPLQGWLKEVKEAACSMQNKLIADMESRQKLVSEALFKNSGRGSEDEGL